MADFSRKEDPRTRANVTGAKHMAIGMGVILVLGLVGWEMFGAHDRLHDITHKQLVSDPNALGEGKDATQPPPGMPKPNKSNGPAAAQSSPTVGGQ